MRAVIERVSGAEVVIDGKLESKINRGLLVLLGISEKDSYNDISYIVDKILNLRIFEDSSSKMNLSVKDISGEILLVSQFTLMGDARKGRRPSFSYAAKPENAKLLYNKVVEELKKSGLIVETGVFQANMKVEHTNDGPVTILLDSEKLF